MVKSFLDPILNPLLNLDSLVAIIIISVTLSAIITILYKYLTDQTLMKSLRDQLKQYQQQMKEHKSEPEKMMEIQKKSMEINMKYMTMSFKPTLYTFIPIILIFGWLNAHLAYEPIMPGQEFTTTIEFDKNIIGNAELIPPKNFTLISDTVQNLTTVTEKGWFWDTQKTTAVWKLKPEKEGDFLIEFKFNNKSFKKDIIITTTKNYAAITKVIGTDQVKSISIDNEKMRPLKPIGLKLGWIWTYILFSILTNIILKKALKIS